MIQPYQRLFYIENDLRNIERRNKSKGGVVRVGWLTAEAYTNLLLRAKSCETALSSCGHQQAEVEFTEIELTRNSNRSK